MPGFGFGTRSIARRRVAAGSVAQLSAGALSVAENSPAGTVIGVIGGGRAGATLTLIDGAGGRLALADRTLVVGSTPIDFEATPSLSATLRQSKPGFADADQSFTVTVTNLFERSSLVALGLSAVAYTIGMPASGTISGATAGSTITAAGLPAGLTIDGPARSWAYDGTGSAGGATVTLTETLADSANSPRATAIGVTIATAGAAPALVSPVVPPADPRVGVLASGSGATFTGAASVAHEVFADGTKVADGTSYTPLAGDFNKVLEYRSTASGGGGTTVSRAYAPVTALFDSLTGPDNSALLSHTGESGNAWAKNSIAAYFGDAIIVGNKMGRGANSNVMVYGFSPSSASYVVEATYTTGSALVSGGAVAFRMSPTAQTFYAFGLTSTGTWGMTKRSTNSVRTTDIVGVAPYDQFPFNGYLFAAGAASTATPVKIVANGTYEIAIHVWDEGSAVQFAIYVNGCLVIRAQDPDATRIMAAGAVGWFDAQAAAVTATTGNKVSNMRVHMGRVATALRADGSNPNTARIDEKPVQAIRAAGSLDLRGAASAYAAGDGNSYTRSVGGWCEGGTTDVKVRVEKAVGGDTVVDWVSPAGLVIAGPRWFGTIALPRNKPTTNSAGDAWDVLKFRAYRGATLVRTGTSARFGNGIAATAVGSSIAAVWGVGDANGGNEMAMAGLTPNPNTALQIRYGGSYYFHTTTAGNEIVAGRPSADVAPYGWRIASAIGVGANIFMNRMQAEFGGLVFTVAGGVGGSSIGSADGSGWLDTANNINGWRAQMLAIGGVNLVTEDFGINEARVQTASAGVLTRADMLARWNAFHAAVRAIGGFTNVPIIVKGSPSDTSTAQTSGANNPTNNRHARQAEIDAAAYDAATYRGPAQFDVQRYDGLHPHTTSATGTQLVGARLAEQSIAILKGTTPARLAVIGAARVSDTQTRFTVAGVTADALTARNGTPGWEIATGGDLDQSALAVSGAVYEGTTGGVATYLVTHASTAGAPYRAGYGEAAGQGTGGTSTVDTTSLRDTRATYPRAVEQTAGGIAVSA